MRLTVPGECRDLIEAAEKLSPVDQFASIAPGGLASGVDGSYFTDYVHHIAMSKPGMSPREVTRNLVASLLRLTEMEELIKSHEEATIPLKADRARLADVLLCCFGWHETRVRNEQPLAGCIEKTVDGAPRLRDSLAGNDVRIRLESSCKDIVDLVVAQLGYSDVQVWEAIEERAPAYVPNSRQSDWSEEVAKMTVGSAIRVLEALGPLAFPGRQSEIQDFLSALRELPAVLNEASHHQEHEAPTTDKNDLIALRIEALLQSAFKCVGELPWHLSLSFVYGEGPKVVSGEAWSHASPTPRFVKVIVWAGERIRHQLLLWNKSGRNPIVTDPLFIERPSRRGAPK
jgi:hypothetical protein